MAAADESMQNLPLVLLHRPPSFTLPLKDRLSAHFQLLDPVLAQEPANSLNSVRALVCVGYAPITSETLSVLPSLELIVASSAGLDHIDLKECRGRGITITNASVAFAEDVADQAVALLIDVLRRISAADRFVRSGLWPMKGDYPLGFKLGGKRVGIVGFGSIGSEVAKRLEAFGCRIAYNSRRKKPSVPFPYYANVLDLAAESDILILCCSLTEETHHLINGNVMKTLGREGVIINVGRGSLIDEKELVQFLVQGKIGGAGLDVFENEPYVPKELFSLDNVVLSPHVAVFTPESIEAILELIFSNLKAFFSNEPLLSVVQPE
ncbi:glyoxylate/hydroxypyruvate reductase HPR3 [Ricinus communis]|uniref:glyoxylate reductase (NADP(+)) n=1 Tax=Ricinus communis TaxID=3988 RepID=B9RBY8_RICCO|nr:glyoxylate/hydroxypyruvate reductase HPR3 [Ricinus communis]EEF51059.1 glycerate dehydrogenase, putative [Ricinus communis]|eukprot:XP_002509672.1 glyoxylate/hydroxypyruvate reductase HPR3 [Ricinus communis]